MSEIQYFTVLISRKGRKEQIFLAFLASMRKNRELLRSQVHKETGSFRVRFMLDLNTANSRFLEQV